MNSTALLRLILMTPLAAVACGPQSRSEIGPRAGRPDLVSGMAPEETKCNGLGDLSCISLSLPVASAAAGGREVVVTFAVRESGTSNREALLLIGGGPGEAVIESVGAWLPSIDPRLLEHRDIVTFDLRGAFRSGNRGCPLADDIWQRQILTAKKANQRSDLLRAAKTFAAACATELDVAATDLPYYNSVEAAHDIEAFRRLRKYDHLTIYAYSYGTQLAQIYASLFPDRVKNMVLDGTVDLTASAMDFDIQLVDVQNQILSNILKQCLDQPNCASGFSTSPRQALLRLKRALDRDAKLSRSTPNSARCSGVFTAYDLDLVASQSIYDLQGRSDFLEALSAFDRTSDLMPLYRLLCATPGANVGRSESEKNLGRAARDGDRDRDRGIYYLFICNDYGRGGRSQSERLRTFEALAERVESGSRVIRSPGYSELPCLEWPSAPALSSALPSTTIPITVPTLLVAATMDTAVPYEQSLSLLERSPSASLIKVEGGHHIMYGNGNDCVDGAVNLFLLQAIQPDNKIQTCPA